MERVRTFIAIELEGPLRKRLAEVQEQLEAQMPPGLVRWVKPESIHLTLKFLGGVPAARLGEIGEGLERACRGFAPFAFQVTGLGCFPNFRRPTVVWVGVEEPEGTLARLQEAVEREMARLGFPPEGRAFTPHLTLGRTRRQAGSRALRQVGELIKNTPLGKLGEIKVEAISLMRSDLLPTGAVYTRLKLVPLGCALREVESAAP